MEHCSQKLRLHRTSTHTCINLGELCSQHRHRRVLLANVYPWNRSRNFRHFHRFCSIAGASRTLLQKPSGEMDRPTGCRFLHHSLWDSSVSQHRPTLGIACLALARHHSLRGERGNICLVASCFGNGNRCFRNSASPVRGAATAKE